VDRFDSMRVFAKVVENSSFTGAAARLYISASMVTLHVKELEERLGVRLLNRATRKVSLTRLAAPITSAASGCWPMRKPSKP
jgi:DNA-binding transcriptional LysR family regulator